MAEYVSNEMYAKYKLENLLNKSKSETKFGKFIGNTGDLMILYGYFQLQKMDHQEFSFVPMIICWK